MIPVPLLSLPQLLLLLLVPLLGGALTLGLLGRALYWRLARRGGIAEFFTRSTLALTALAVACNLWTGYLYYLSARLDREIALKTHYRESRSRFVLAQDFRYGELLIPKGSLIDRHDAFDNGEPQRPLGLRGLRAVRFPHPVQVAGVWAIAMEAYPARLELAHDQRIGPVLRFDREAEDGYGAWVTDASRPTLACRRGEVALFEAPSIDYDIAAEFSRPGPDGPAARFRPSQWTVRECESDRGPIEVPPAYTGPAPESAQAPVWGRLPVAAGD
jgi:hypothetical protein